jgi:hypothetical protein
LFSLDSNRFKLEYNERGKANQLPVHQEQKTKVLPSTFITAAAKQRERIYWVVLKMSSLLTTCKEIYQAGEIILYYTPK